MERNTESGRVSARESVRESESEKEGICVCERVERSVRERLRKSECVCERGKQRGRERDNCMHQCEYDMSGMS
jgi:hypothetical protein